MQGYEIVTIVDPQIADEDVPKTTEKINEFITSRGGSVARVQKWGRRRLAYPIKRQTEAHYLLTTFELDPKHSSELEADLVLAQEVLKHMVVKLDAEEFKKASEEPPPPVAAEPPVESTEPAAADDAAAAETSAAEPVAEVSEAGAEEESERTEDAVEAAEPEGAKETADDEGPGPGVGGEAGVEDKGGA